MGKNGGTKQVTFIQIMELSSQALDSSYSLDDANNPDYVFVAIEAGALIQSHDGGKSWIDLVKQGLYDTHSGHTSKST